MDIKTSKIDAAGEPGSPGFSELFDGKCIGLRKWPDFDRLLENVRGQPQGWYVYMVGREVPEHPVEPPRLEEFLEELSRLLKRDHDHDYCGIVYADDPAAPRLVKIYDPGNLGSSCGSCGYRVLPGWVLSRVRPEPLDSVGPIPMGRQRWWRRLFPGGGTR